MLAGQAGSLHVCVWRCDEQVLTRLHQFPPARCLAVVLRPSGLRMSGRRFAGRRTEDLIQDRYNVAFAVGAVSSDSLQLPLGLLSN
jgi:hypothetical protein